MAISTSYTEPPKGEIASILVIDCEGYSKVVVEDSNGNEYVLGFPENPSREQIRKAWETESWRKR